MGHDLTRRAHALMMRALEIEDAERRLEFVTQECGDDVELLDRMRALLKALDEQKSFLESPAIARPESAVIRTSPDAMGGYRIIRAIGVGGMATVYEAMQESPKRRVALKVMRQALTQTSAVERFRFETEVLASLRHPCIAQIYEASASDDGHGVSTPYFAMEFIPDALPITAYAAERDLTLRERLEMLLPVFDAVHHGHQLGVIHRDLKPGNILVDSAGNPKVIDFGIARSIDPESAALTQEESGERVIGTLNYMSPEQHAGESASLDIRTDIYALGVLLYELACERLPHDFSKVGLMEAARIVRESAPERPGAVDPQLRGDLEAVIMKALDPDRDRRYQAVPDFAADIRRYLDNVPVLARPATTVYRLRKFAQRRRGLVGSISAVSLAIALGVAATARQAYIATIARDREREQRMLAEQREEELEQVAEFQSKQLSEIDVRAMAGSLERAILERYETAAQESPDVDAKSAEQLRTQLELVNFIDVARGAIDEELLIKSATAIDEQFGDQPLIRARLLFALAGTANELGLLDRAEASLEKAIEIREAELGGDDPQTLEVVHALAAHRLSQGRWRDSLPLMERVIEGRTKALGADHPETLNARTNYAHVIRRLGEIERSEALYRELVETQRRVAGPDNGETIEALNNLAVALAMQRKLDEAEIHWTEALERRRRAFGDDHPHVAVLIANLGRMMMDKGEFEKAEPYLRESLERRRVRFGDEHPRTLAAMHSYAVSLRTLRRFDEAEAAMQTVLEGRIASLGADHSNTLATKAALADIYRYRGDFEQAELTHREVLEARRSLFGDESEMTQQSMGDVSESLIGLGRNKEALALATEAVALSRAHLPARHFRIGLLLGIEAAALAGLERYAEAAPIAVESYDLHLEAYGVEHERTQAIAGLLSEIYAGWNAQDPTAERGEQAKRWRALTTEGD